MRVYGSKLTLRAFDRNLDHAAGCEIDLTRTTFVDTYGLVALTCILQDARRRGQAITFRPPRLLDCRNYLSRMGFADRLREAGAHDHGLSDVTHWPQAGRLVELQPFTSTNEVEGLAEILYSRLSDSHRTALVAARLYEAVEELGANVLEHSEVGRGFVAAQVFLRGTPSQNIVFALGDAGIGLRSSLVSAGFPASDDLRAVDLALTLDISASGEPGRGQGLPSVVDLVSQVGGTIVMRSGQAKVRAGASRFRTMTPHPLAGTIVAAHVPCGVNRL